MEPAGILRCFLRSVGTLKLCFVNFIADGDSKAFLEVVNADPYNGIQVKKRRVCWTYPKACWHAFTKVKKGIWEYKVIRW